MCTKIQMNNSYLDNTHATHRIADRNVLNRQVHIVHNTVVRVGVSEVEGLLAVEALDARGYVL